MFRKTCAKSVVFLAIPFLLAACGSNTSSTGKEGDIVATELIKSPSKTETTAALQSVGLPVATLKYDVACYKLTYKTPDLTDALVNVSGLVCLPQGKSGASPLLSFQHGTIFFKPEAPTTASFSEYSWSTAAIASSGYIALAPDYLGYGVSSAIPHPYLHAKTISSTVVNLLRAAKKFLALPAINMATNGQLFLSGYSEGGFATLATQKKIELELASEFTVTASEPGAGPYDMTGTVRAQVASTSLVNPANAALMVKAYDMIYNSPSRISSYFTPTQAAQLDSLYSGNINTEDINNALGGSVISTNSLFNQAFLDSYNGNGEAAFKAGVAENDIYNWKPTTPTVLFHGEDDEAVPYANTTTALQAMAAKGASNVSIHTCNAGGTLPTTHLNCEGPHLVDMMATFSPMAQGL